MQQEGLGACISSALLGLSVLGLLYWLFKRPPNLPPGPRAWPVFGARYYIRNQNQIYLDYDRMGKQFGDISCIYTGKRLEVVLSTQKIIKEALIKRGMVFNDRNPAYLGNDFVDFTDEIFNCPVSEEWYGRKRFALKALKNAGFGTKESEDKIITEVQELVKWIGKQGDAAFDIEDALVSFHANVIYGVLFSARYDWFSVELDKMVAAGREYYAIVEASAAIMNELPGQYLPLWLIKIMYRRRIKEISGGFRHSRELVAKFMKEKRQEQLDPDNPKDLLESYLLQRKDDFDEHMFTKTVCVLMPDSIDSQAVMELWIFLFLAYNPDIQRLAQEEIDRVCGTRQPRLDDKPDCPYITACIMDSTRLGVPLATSLAHTVTEDTTLGGYNIPKDNTLLICNFYGGNRDPAVFSHPNKFHPYHFLDDQGQLTNVDNLLSYGLGKRSCMGKTMSEAEVFLIVASVMQYYTLKFPDGEPPPTMDAVSGSLFRRTAPFKLVAVPR